MREQSPALDLLFNLSLLSCDRNSAIWNEQWFAAYLHGRGGPSCSLCCCMTSFSITPGQGSRDDASLRLQREIV